MLSASLASNIRQKTIGNQLKVKPNDMVADDALIQHCATAHCACKMAATLTRETPELTGPDLWSSNLMPFRPFAVTVLFRPQT